MKKGIILIAGVVCLLSVLILAACTGGGATTSKTTTSQPTTTTTSVIPALPASHRAANWPTDCRSCHATGTGGPQFPANHANYTNAQCTNCHK
jgi:hypothetical protein